MISKEQLRSKFALEQLNNKKIPDELATFIVGAPTMILQNGFGQTMAFLLSKCKGKADENDKHYFTFKTIAAWSNKVNGHVPAGEPGFFSAVSQLKQSDYLSIQEEALKMLQWLKRYARAFQEESR